MEIANFGGGTNCASLHFLASIFVAYVEPKLFSLSHGKILQCSPYLMRTGTHGCEEGVSWRVGGCRRRSCRSEGDHPKSCAGAFVGAQHDATVIRYGASNFGEGNIAAGVAESDDRNEGVGRQVGDDVGKASGRREHGDVQCACVR